MSRLEKRPATQAAPSPDYDLSTLEWLTVQEFASELRVAEPTVRKWIAAGRVRAARLPGGKLYRIPASELLVCRTIS